MLQEAELQQVRILRRQVKSLLEAAGRIGHRENLDAEDALFSATNALRSQVATLLANTPFQEAVPGPLALRSWVGGLRIPVHDIVTVLSSLEVTLGTLLESETSDGEDLVSEVELLRTKVVEAEARSLALLDDELRDRCLDLLLRPGKADTAVREAGVVLENRIRKKAELPDELVGVGLVDSALSPGKGVLSFPGTESERQGIHQLYRGTISFFRNPVSHRLIEDYDATRARQVVGFVDLLLQLLRDASAEESATDDQSVT